MNSARNTGARSAGFTLLELVIVMGILCGFLLMLVQFLDSGVQLFDEGETGQSLADRAETARFAVDRELRALRGPGVTVEPGKPGERLVSQMLPLGFPARGAPGEPRGPLFRATVGLAPELEMRVVQDVTLLRAAVELGAGAAPTAIAARAAELAQRTPLRGIGRLLLTVWPKTSDQALLELRVAHFLNDQVLPVDAEHPAVDPFEVQEPGGREWPAIVLHEATDVLVDDLLWFELRFWSQRTRSWTATDDTGPEVVWDSARAGWLSDTAFPPVFRFDRGPQSLLDPTDDVWPHAIRVAMVVASEERRPPEGLLARELEVDATALFLVNGERFPGASDGGFVKVEGEWIQYAERRGDELMALKRGQRGTRARAHESGARCRVGRLVEFTVPLPFGKDDWNG
jgi:hypothetical protein